jgi:DNA-binding HxlR family transcriptional regulator
MKLEKFFAADIRQNSRITPRTLQRHLKELNDYNYLQIVGGNKYKTGYQYELNPTAEKVKLEYEINQQIKEILKKIEQQAKVRQKKK